MVCSMAQGTPMSNSKMKWAYMSIWISGWMQADRIGQRGGCTWKWFCVLVGHVISDWPLDHVPVLVLVCARIDFIALQCVHSQWPIYSLVCTWLPCNPLILDHKITALERGLRSTSTYEHIISPIVITNLCLRSVAQWRSQKCFVEIMSGVILAKDPTLWYIPFITWMLPWNN